MFSPQIQNYINSSSHAAALNRAHELNNYINSIYPQTNTQQTSQISAFEEILAESKQEVPSNSIFDIDTPPNVKKSALNIPFGSLSKMNTNKVNFRNRILLLRRKIW